jgi:hypothetical protein
VKSVQHGACEKATQTSQIFRSTQFSTIVVCWLVCSFETVLLHLSFQTGFGLDALAKNGGDEDLGAGVSGPGP